MTWNDSYGDGDTWKIEAIWSSRTNRTSDTLSLRIKRYEESKMMGLSTWVGGGGY